MSINISQQAEARLVEEAQRQGLSVEALLERLIEERVTEPDAARRKAPELPVWSLGVRTSLHRREIYDDVG